MFAYGEDCMLVLTRNLSQKEFQNFDPAGIPIGICWASRNGECSQKDCPMISFTEFSN